MSRYFFLLALLLVFVTFLSASRTLKYVLSESDSESESESEDNIFKLRSSTLASKKNNVPMHLIIPPGVDFSDRVDFSDQEIGIVKAESDCLISLADSSKSLQNCFIFPKVFSILSLAFAFLFIYNICFVRFLHV